jgi:SAM-dependent methyltransferase
MLKYVMRALNDRVFPYRYVQLTERIAPLLDDVADVLDVGTGDGHLAHYLKEASGCHVTGLDVCLQPHSYIDVHHYDGRTFPFDDNAFDCVLMIDMLHHTEDIEQMLAEACRVARRFVLIKDHFWETRFDMVTLHVADYLGNIPYGVPLPYNYLRLEEWQSLFERHNLDELNRSTFKYMPLEPAQHIMTKLQLENAAEPARALHDGLAQRQLEAFRVAN